MTHGHTLPPVRRFIAPAVKGAIVWAVVWAILMPVFGALGTRFGKPPERISLWVVPLCGIGMTLFATAVQAIGGLVFGAWLGEAPYWKCLVREAMRWLAAGTFVGATCWSLGWSSQLDGDSWGIHTVIAGVVIGGIAGGVSSGLGVVLGRRN